METTDHSKKAEEAQTPYPMKKSKPVIFGTYFVISIDACVF
jgi:hypothetical protein